MRRILVAVFVPLAFFVALPARAAQTTGWTRVASGGFGNPNNAYVIDVAEFRGMLYASTSSTHPNPVWTGVKRAASGIWRSQEGISWSQVGTTGLGESTTFAISLVVFNNALYAIAWNSTGFRLFRSDDGTSFARVGAAGFGNAQNTSATPVVFHDRLLLLTGGAPHGAEVWASDDGASFRRVVSGGLGNKNNTGLLTTDLTPVRHSGMVFRGALYIGTSNLADGGELWRSNDGVAWQRLFRGGAGGRHSNMISPAYVFGGRLYVEARYIRQVGQIEGLDLFSSADGTSFQKIVDNGFNAGAERNVSALLTQFKGRLYMITSTMDPRVLTPGAPTDRRAPQGFQLRSSTDGSTWTKIAADGFGKSSAFFGSLSVIGNALYLWSADYKTGDSLWRSSDGVKWAQILKLAVHPFGEGAGPFVFKDHLLIQQNDLKTGAEMWRQNAALGLGGTGGGSTPTPGQTSTGTQIHKRSQAWLIGLIVGIAALMIAALILVRRRGAQPVPSVEDQLRALGRLHDEGILTDTEFEKKKSELLTHLR